MSFHLLRSCIRPVALPAASSSFATPLALFRPTTPAVQIANLYSSRRLNMPKEGTTKRRAADGKKKSKKDPNAPKRALSAYMFFASAQRKTVQEENPDAAFGDIGRLLGERWKALSDAEKAPYENKAAVDKRRYEEEKAAYAASAKSEY